MTPPLPPEAFTSPAVFDAEMTAIFERSWVHIADLDELQKPGDYQAAAIGRVPVIALLGEHGQVCAFLNACRHRGATLAEGAGHCGKQLSCPYHAWSYNHDGELVGVPYREQFQGVDLSSRGLVAIRVELLGPLVFACLDPDAPAFGDYAGEIVGAMERARGEQMRAAFDVEYDVACNWKAYVENGMEGYHVEVVHDMLSDLVTRDGTEHVLEDHSSYTLAPINDTYREMIPRPDHLAEDDHKVRFGFIFPNIIPVITPADVSYLRIDPLAHDRIRLRGRSFDLPGPARDIVRVSQRLLRSHQSTRHRRRRARATGHVRRRAVRAQQLRRTAHHAFRADGSSRSSAARASASASAVACSLTAMRCLAALSTSRSASTSMRTRCSSAISPAAAT